MQWDLHLQRFNTEVLQLGKTQERIVRGGCDRFALLPQAFAGIQHIGMIGCGSQGPAQAQESARHAYRHGRIQVSVELCPGSGSVAAPR